MDDASEKKPVAIRVEGVSKYFPPQSGTGSLKQLITSFFRGSKPSGDSGYMAVEDINFEINQGEFVGIVGRNGSGKSTLLKMIAGVYTPTTGAITVNGRLIPFIELGVGFNPELSGRDNVFLNSALLGFTRKETELMYQEIVDFAELEEHMDVKLKNYSSGMQVRLAFSIAIRAKADVLLIDEVLAVGDAAFQKKCFDYFDMLKQEKKTVVFVTHDMSAVQKFCDRAIVIKDSKMMGSFSPDEARAAYFQISDESSEKGAPSGKRKELRWGTGEIQVQSAKLISSDGSVLKSVASGEDLLVRIRLKNSHLSASDPVVLGVNLTSPNGENLLGPNTAKEKIVAGTKEVVLRIKNPNLNDGVYTLGTAIFNPSYSILYDHYEKCSTFRIINNSGKHGVLLLETTWEVTAK
jgi:ABC-2 type transport system ATP-binding protein